MFNLRKAFTLIELSIVLIIVGLIIGAINFGGTLVRNSQILTISNEINQFRSAISNFIQQYNGLPGDITNSSTLWPNCASAAGDSGIATSCDGNGDEVIGCSPINPSCNSSESTERLRAWQHLSLAGLLSNTYSGFSSGGFNLGVDTPVSKYPYAGYIFNKDSCYNTGNHYLYLASKTFSSVITPQDALYLDTKMDDANPSTGSVIASSPDSSINSSCSTSTTNACFNASTYNYYVNNNSPVCLLAMSY